MRRKFLFLFVITSIMSNIYLGHALCNNKTSTAKHSSNIIVKTTPLDVDITPEDANDFFENNPIDKFFNNHKLTDYSNISMSNVAYVYCDLWKAEMDNAYQALIHAAHDDIKSSLKDSQRLIMDYAESEARISCAVGGSNAFGDESGKVPEKISYGTIHAVLWHDAIGQIYKNRTKELFKHCQNIGIKVKFLFNEKSLEKYDELRFVKKEK